MEQFFSDEPAADIAYTNIRTGSDRWTVAARALVEKLWRTYEPYADRAFLGEARSALHARFWEMYLTCSLLDCGVAVVPRARRKFRVRGPDVQTEAPLVWIEAVAPTKGSGPDAVAEPEHGIARNVPDDQISLRLLSAIRDKLQDKKRHVEAGIVQREDPFVIAVNGASIPSARTEREVPRIVRAVLPIGHEQVHLDVESFAVIGRSHVYRGSITKSVGVSVPTTLFQDAQSAGLSAIVYSVTDAWNPPDRLGGDFVIVKNPMAACPLPDAVCRRGVMYWVDGDLLQARDLSDSV